MTTENTNSGSNVTTLNALAGFQQTSLFGNVESLNPLAGIADSINTSTSALAASGVLGATDFSPAANAIAGIESPAPRANAVIDAMYTPSVLASTIGVRNSALKASAALGSSYTPAFHDAVSSIENVNAATDFEHSIGMFGGPSALADAANTAALDALSEFETATSPLLTDGVIEMEELANQTGFTSLSFSDAISQLALSPTDYEFDALLSHEEYTESPVDRDLKWSVAKCVYYSVKLNLEQIGIPMVKEFIRKTAIICYVLSVLCVYTPFTLTASNIVTVVVIQAVEFYDEFKNN